MAAPVNSVIGSATVIAALPYTGPAQNVRDSGTNYTVYYTYTTSATDEVLSLWGEGINPTYLPDTSVFSDVGGTVYHGINNFNAKPIYFSVSPHTQYWFKFLKDGDGADPATVTVHLQAFTQGTAPTGSLFINDASLPEVPAGLLSSTTGEPLRYILDFPGGEAMTQLLSGQLLLENADEGRLDIYTSEYVFVDSILDPFTNVSSNRTTLFYAADSNTKIVTSYTSVGVSVDTWTTSGFPAHISPNRADTILYYAGGASGDAIKRWDLVNDLGLTDLAVGVTGYIVKEIFVLGDGTILVIYRRTSPYDVYLVRYDTSGITLTTYVTQLNASTGADTHLALANDDPQSFWCWIKIAGQFSRFMNIQTTTGTILTSFDQIHYTNGLYDGAFTDDPSSDFGHSESCTFVITLTGVTPAPTFTTDILIPRRQRRAPHLSREQMWNFYSQFQLDLETGVGLTSGYGSDPQIMLRWSDDGGHTWSKEHWASAGARGQYAFRAMWRRLGRSRDRVFEVTVSDPVAWNLLAAYLQVEPGTS